jgi:hypothetical protein
VGFSDLSGSSRPDQARQDLTAQVDSAISNISFASGVMSFDNKLTNARGAFSTDKTIYRPLEFQIVSISNPTVTVRNADTGSNTFIYDQTLALGQTSAAKRLEFNDPGAQLFSFDARVYGNAYASSTIGTGSQSPDGTSPVPGPVTYSLYQQVDTGQILGGEPSSWTGASVTWGDPAFKGITWEDVPITTKSDALILEVAMTSVLGVDMDLELRTAGGQVLDESGEIGSTEFVSSEVQPNTTYIVRIKGWATGPSDFTLTSTQLLPNGSPNENAGTRTVGGSPIGGGGTSGANPISGLFRFLVNPITRQVTVTLLN